MNDLQTHPRFSIFTERFNSSNDTPSTKHQETECTRIKNISPELIFEVEVEFHSLNPHPVFQVATPEPRITPLLFMLKYIDFNRDTQLLYLTSGKIGYYNPYSGLKYTTSL